MENSIFDVYYYSYRQVVTRSMDFFNIFHYNLMKQNNVGLLNKYTNNMLVKHFFLVLGHTQLHSSFTPGSAIRI